MPSAWADGESQDVGARTEGITRTSTDATNPVIYTTKIENSLTVTSDGKVQWGNDTQALGDYSTAFGNYTKTAAVTSIEYNGIVQKVNVQKLDQDGNPIPVTDPETHQPSTTVFETEEKYAIVDANNHEVILSNGYFDTEEEATKELRLNATITGGYGATAFGLYSEANGAHSTAFGVGTTARGTGATAFGFKTIANGGVRFWYYSQRR